MKLVRLIANLGYGSRKQVASMFREGRVTDPAGEVLYADDKVGHGDVRIDGEPLDPPAGLVLVLNKPLGVTCSTRDPGRIVYDLLPPRFRLRSPALSPVGRLDRDTTGLLLLTDDGALLHRIISPRSHLPKVYEATLARDLRGDEGALFASGTLMLESETTPLAPATLEVLEPRRARLTLTEGRYHQVRRMFAAVGNHVEALHRSRVGGLDLGDLASGHWRPLDAGDIGRLFGARGVNAPAALAWPPIAFRPAAVLFDMDGLMIESERHLLECWRQASAELALGLDDTLWLSMVGHSDRACRQLLHDRLAADAVEALTARTRVLYDARVEAGLPLRPGTRAILDWIAALGLPRAVVTSTHRWRTDQKLERCDLRRYFEVVVTGDEVRESKPAPDIYRLAASRLGIAPARCVVLEDSVPGVRAALAAGMTPIQVPDLVAPDAAARALGHRIVASLDQARALIAPALA